jgi:DNA gyrase subunit A
VLLDTLVAELTALGKRFATPRRTRLVEGGDALVAQRAAAIRPNAELQRQQAFGALAPESRLLIQADGAVKILSPQMLGRLHLDEPIELGDHPSPARLILPIAEQPLLLAFTGSGRVALLRWEFAGQQPGKLERFLPDSIEGEPVVQVLPMPGEGSLGLLSSDGRFKRLPVEEFQELSGRATTVLKLKEGVTLRRVVAGQEGDTLVVASSTGRMLRLCLDETQLPLMGRAAQGPILMRLLPGEVVVGAACLPEIQAETNETKAGTVVLATASGQLKRLLVSSLRPCQRGDMGQIGLRLQKRGDYLVDLQGAGSAVLGLLTDKGWSSRIGSDELAGENTSGTGISLQLPQGQQLQELVPLIN